MKDICLWDCCAGKGAAAGTGKAESQRRERPKETKLVAGLPKACSLDPADSAFSALTRVVV